MIKNPFGGNEKEAPFQLQFAGLKVKKGSVYNISQFFKALRSYLKKRIVLVFRFFYVFPSIALKTTNRSKDFFTRKLIWSRGRLGRPIANFAILTVALIAFLTGGVFSGSQFVNGGSISPDYLAKTEDIIPQVTVATTALPEGRRTEAVIHEVKSGETLSSIGALYKVTIDALRYVNSLTDQDYLKVGQKLTIPPVQGIIYTIKDGDTCQTIADKFDVPAQAIQDFNYLDSCTSLETGKDLVIPDAKIPPPQVVAPPVTSTPTYQNYVGPELKAGWCIWPTTVRIITQYFTYYHNGVDIATPWGFLPPIYACGQGVVTRAGWDPFGLGLHVVISHSNGYSTVYGHMSKLLVSVGEDVDKGEQIGIMGSTGRSTGPHVHFMVEHFGVPQNPLNYIK